jgi:general secretion pathway protein K
VVKRRDQRGVALVFVLWLLVLLGAAAAEVASRARSETLILSSLRARTLGRYAAESGILTATTRIEALLDSTRVPTQRVAMLRRLDALSASLEDIELGSARFGVAVVDLNARIDLNRADDRTLRGLFTQFIPQSRAEAIVAALRREPLERLGELTRVPGVDDSLALAVAPYVTVWSDGVVNINSAPEPVLAALPAVGSAGARTIVRRRAAGEVFTSITFGPPVSIIPTRLMLVSRGWQQGHPLTHEIQAVYALVGQRLVLERWEERDR